MAILTSQNGVRFFFELVETVWSHTLTLPKIAVIGKKTAEELEALWLQGGFYPTEFVAEKFVAEFVPKLHADARVLFAKGNLARTIIAERMNKAGAIVMKSLCMKRYFQKKVCQSWFTYCEHRK